MPSHSHGQRKAGQLVNELKKFMHKCNECIYIQIALCRFSLQSATVYKLHHNLYCSFCTLANDSQCRLLHQRKLQNLQTLPHFIQMSLKTETFSRDSFLKFAAKTRRRCHRRQSRVVKR